MYDDCFLLDTGPLVLPWAGLMDADDPLMMSFADFFRDGPNRQAPRPAAQRLDRAVLEHEISSCEPCYSWNIVNSWKTGDRAAVPRGDVLAVQPARSRRRRSSTANTATRCTATCSSRR